VNPPIVYGQPCADCRRPMIPRARRHLAPEGMVRHTAGGLCSTCYHKLHAVHSAGRASRGPSYDVDEIAVERAIRGDPPAGLNSGEITAAVAVLTQRGLSIRVIARRLGVAQRTVDRARARVRLSNGHSPTAVSFVAGQQGVSAPAGPDLPAAYTDKEADR